jgi:hypothetical protein
LQFKKKIAMKFLAGFHHDVGLNITNFGTDDGCLQNIFKSRDDHESFKLGKKNTRISPVF